MHHLRNKIGMFTQQVRVIAGVMARTRVRAMYFVGVTWPAQSLALGLGLRLGLRLGHLARPELARRQGMPLQISVDRGWAR